MDEEEMLAEDWTGGVYKNLAWIKTALWLLVALEVAKFILW